MKRHSIFIFFCLNSLLCLAQMSEKPENVIDSIPESIKQDTLAVQLYNVYPISPQYTKKQAKRMDRVNKIANKYNDQIKLAMEDYPYPYALIEGEIDSARYAYRLCYFPSTELVDRDQIGSNRWLESFFGNELQWNESRIYYYYFIYEASVDKAYVKVWRHGSNPLTGIRAFCYGIKK